MTQGSLLSKALTTSGLIGLSYIIRFVSNLILARLLAPEIFGVIVVVQSLRMGVELLADIGIEQNIVQNPKGPDERFFNTAWTLQICRSVLLTALFLITAPWLATFFRVDLAVLVAISFVPLANGLASPAIFLLARGLEVRRRNLFELKVEAIHIALAVLLTSIWPVVWAPIAAMLISMTARTWLSYKLPHPPHRLLLDREAVGQVVGFSKWIMASSLLLYASANLDRLYLARFTSLEMLGIFGIAKSLADLPPNLARRLSYQIVFPFIAARTGSKGAREMHELLAARWKFVVLAATGMGVASAWSDWVVAVLYDSRYAAAGWMLATLLVGAFLSVLSGLNEAKLMGIGRPAFGTYANLVRLTILGVAVPLGFTFYEVPGVVAALVISELGLYVGIAAGQHVSRMTFWRQDAAAMLLFALAIAGMSLIRVRLGLELPFPGLLSGGAG